MPHAKLAHALKDQALSVDRAATAKSRPTKSSRPSAPPTDLSDCFSELPLLDREISQTSRAMLPASAVREIYGTCISQTMDHCLKLESAVKKQDRASIRAAAHAIGGNASMLGAVRIAALARNLQRHDCTADSVHLTLAQLTGCCQELSNETGKEGLPL